MSRKLLVVSSLLAGLFAVTFDTSEAEAGRCCRSRGRRCCGGGMYGGGYAGNCGWRGGCNTACYSGCNTGCNVAWSGACAPQVALNDCVIQPCSFQGGCPVPGGRLIAEPGAATAAPPPPPEPGSPSNEPPAPAAPPDAAPAPAPGT